MCRIKLYSRVSDKETVCEIWGGSTKHPDVVYYFSDYEKNKYLENVYQIFQWLCEIASKQLWPFHAVDIVEYALKYAINW